MALTRNVLAKRAKIPALENMSEWIANKLVKFLGFDPFKLLYFVEYDHNPSFANCAFSNPSLFDALEQAGQVLEEKQSPHLKHVSHHFNQKVTSTIDVERTAGSIIAFFSCLPSARNGYGLLMNLNDVKLLLMDSIKLLLQSEVSEERVKRLNSNPMILPSGELSWVKYKFVSNTSIEKRCICEEKICDLDVTVWYYWFPSESYFRQELRRIERDI